MLRSVEGILQISTDVLDSLVMHRMAETVRTVKNRLTLHFSSLRNPFLGKQKKQELILLDCYDCENRWQLRHR